RDFSYDDAGRKTGETWVNSGGGTANVLTFTYNAVNQVLTAADYDGTYTLTYDDVGRVSSAKDMWGKTLTFTYDAASHRTKVEDSDGGVQTSTYDDAGRLTRREHTGQATLRIDLGYKATNDLQT